MDPSPKPFELSDADIERLQPGRELHKIRCSDGNVYGFAWTMDRFRAIVQSFAPLTKDTALFSFRIYDNLFLCVDNATNEVKFSCLFEEGDLSKQPSKYAVIHKASGNLVGMCDDFNGFTTCVRAVCNNFDLSTIHDDSQTRFEARTPENIVVFYSIRVHNEYETP